uniref:PDZ domain-containing protein n=1 Tax=Periophthalmus magnuspinnatus TaxID=409849 RepID=A0A3B4AK88_9GOBI
ADISFSTLSTPKDPWVRFTDSSPKRDPPLDPAHPFSTSPAQSIPDQPPTMSDNDETQLDVNGNSSFDKENENKLELTGPAVKQGPPVAPKPVWYRQSLKKIREEQTQKKTTKSPVDPPSSVGYSRSFGSRGQTSSNTNLSIRQKIHSFETFSSPESPEKVITAKRQVSTSSSLPTIEKETKVKLTNSSKKDDTKDINANVSSALMRSLPLTHSAPQDPQDPQDPLDPQSESSEKPGSEPGLDSGFSVRSQLEDIHVVILHKEEGAGLGFTVAGGSDLENKAPTVHRVFPSGLAAQEGTVQKGDQVLSINGQSLSGATHLDATSAVRQARTLSVAVVVVRKRPLLLQVEAMTLRRSGESEEDGGLVSVSLDKGCGGVGFTLEGGRGSIHGDKPLVINRISTAGAAEQSGLRSGDEVVSVQGLNLTDMTRFEAWNYIKALPEGVVTVTVRRRAQ